MIYFKKKSLIKKAVNKIKEKMENFKFPIFSFSRGFFLFFGFFLFTLYSSYLFLLPKYLTGEIIEKAINNYVLKNYKYSLDVAKFVVKPNYKLDVNLKADSIRILYPYKADFICVKNIDIDINLISLLFGYLDLNKIKTDKIEINTKFTKDKTYECFRYFILGSDVEQKTKFKLRNMKLFADTFEFNLYDENIKQKYRIKTGEIKVIKSDYKKPITINTKGEISTHNYKISDFDLNLDIKINPNSVGKFWKKFFDLNYNPFYYPDRYKFYSKTKIDLKINPSNKKFNANGVVFLSDYSFKINNVQLPKNNLVLNFKNGKVSTNCDFKFIKNQFIKIDSILDFNKNNFIEAKLKSNELNLSDLREIIDAVGKIFNFHYNLSNINISGFANVDIYLKSDFKTINSNGRLLIKNAKILDKNTGLVLKDIDSDINFANNVIDILTTSAYVNEARFNLAGKIDSKTNLDIKIFSDELNVAQVLNLFKEFPFANTLLSKINEYEFKNGFIRINSVLSGTLKNPIFNSNSILRDLRICYKKYNIEVFIPKFELKFLQNDVVIPKTKIVLFNIPFFVDGIIKDYKTKNSETTLNIESSLPKENKIIKIKDKNIVLKSVLNIKQNKATISSFNVSDLIYASGDISNINVEPNLNVKFVASENIGFILPKFQNLKLNTKGNVLLSGNIQKPNLLGNLFINNIQHEDIGLYIPDLMLNIKNSEFHLNIIKGRIFDFDFDLISNAQLEKDKLVIKTANIQSMYINLESFEKYLKNSSVIEKLNYEIKKIVANIATIETSDILLNSVNFEGDIKNDVLNISKFSAETLSGKISGKGKINLISQKNNLEVILEDLNIRQLSNKLKEISIAASGKLSALIKAEFIGFNLDNILNTLVGNIEFSIENGELNQFAKFERFLQAGNLLSQSIFKSNFLVLTKQNSGDFKTIEGQVQIQNSIADIEYIKTQGSNMSLIIEGKFNLLNQNLNAKILGRIPNSSVSFLGNFDKKDSMTNIEKRFSINLSDEDINKIPQLAYQVGEIQTREFIVLIDGVIKNLNSIKEFKWIIK